MVRDFWHQRRETVVEAGNPQAVANAVYSDEIRSADKWLWASLLSGSVGLLSGIGAIAEYSGRGYNDPANINSAGSIAGRMIDRYIEEVKDVMELNARDIQLCLDRGCDQVATYPLSQEGVIGYSQDLAQRPQTWFLTPEEKEQIRDALAEVPATEDEIDDEFVELVTTSMTIVRDDVVESKDALAENNQLDLAGTLALGALGLLTAGGLMMRRSIQLGARAMEKLKKDISPETASEILESVQGEENDQPFSESERKLLENLRKGEEEFPLSSRKGRRQSLVSRLSEAQGSPSL
jgi:hypothetical protein